MERAAGPGRLAGPIRSTTRRLIARQSAAHHLRSQGIGRFLRAFVCGRTARLSTLLGILKAGAAYHLLTNYPRERIIRAGRCRRALVVSNASSPNGCRILTPILRLDGAAEELARGHAKPSGWPNGDDRIYVTFTSGSTVAKKERC